MSIYFPVDVNFYDSPEFFEVNMSARGLWVTCGTWCKRHLTDGVIPAKIVRHLGGTVRQIKTLIKNNVWAESEQNGTKVYIFCHWFEHNLSREEVEERRRKWRESKQRSRAKNRPEQRKPAKPQSGPPQDVHHDVHDDVPHVREEVIEENKRGGGQVPADPPTIRTTPQRPAAPTMRTSHQTATCRHATHAGPSGKEPKPWWWSGKTGRLSVVKRALRRARTATTAAWHKPKTPTETAWSSGVRTMGRLQSCRRRNPNATRPRRQKCAE